MNPVRKKFLAIGVAAASMLFLPLLYERYKTRHEVEASVVSELRCPPAERSLLVDQLVGSKDPRDHGQFTQLEALVDVLAKCTIPTAYRGGKIAGLVTGVASRFSLDQKFNAIAARPIESIDLIRTILGNVDSDPALSRRVVELMIDNHQLFRSPAYSVLTSATEASHRRLLEEVSGRIATEHRQLQVLNSEGKVADALVIAKSLLPRLRSLLVLQRFSNPDDARIATSLQALGDMSGGLSMVASESNLEIIKSLERHQVIVRRLFQGFESDDFLYEALLVSRPAEGPVVLRTRRENRFKSVGPTYAWLSPGTPATINTQLVTGESVRGHHYYVFPDETMTTVGQSLEAIDAITAMLTTPHVTRGTEFGEGEPKPAAPESLTVQTSANDVQLSQSSGDPPSPTRSSNLEAEARQAFDAMVSRSSIATLHEEDNTQLVKVLSNPVSTADWLYLIKLDAGYSEVSSCTEAGCFAFESTIRMAMIEAESIIKAKGAKPPGNLKFDYKVLRAAGR